MFYAANQQFPKEHFCRTQGYKFLCNLFSQSTNLGHTALRAPIAIGIISAFMCQNCCISSNNILIRTYQLFQPLYGSHCHKSLMLSDSSTDLDYVSTILQHLENWTGNKGTSVHRCRPAASRRFLYNVPAKVEQPEAIWATVSLSKPQRWHEESNPPRIDEL